MSELLRNIASLHTGHTIRSRQEIDPDGDCVFIQVKDWEALESAASRESITSRIVSKDLPDIQILKDQDILIVSKGTNNRAILYNGQFPMAVAASFFTIVRLRSERIKPAFLVWYINSPKAQEYFTANRAGTTTLNLSKKAIEDLPVPIPSLENQERIIRLADTHAHYMRLMNEYRHLTTRLVEGFLNNQLNEA